MSTNTPTDHNKAAHPDAATSPDSLVRFNAATRDDALKLVTHWCAAPAWASAVVAERPYTSVAGLGARAEKLWVNATLDDLLTAFAAHPAIGDVELLRTKYASQANAEQGQVLQASDQTINRLAAQNIAYRERHGFTFIVFATGKSAEQMLDLLNARIANPTTIEHCNAAGEQLKIMQLRLQQSLLNTASANQTQDSTQQS